MKTILEILKKAGGWHHGLYLKIENPPYMALVIEATDESGPCGLACPFPLLTTANRTATSCATRRCVSSLALREERTLTPFYCRNDYARNRAIVPLNRERQLRLSPRALRPARTVRRAVGQEPVPAGLYRSLRPAAGTTRA